ncbi:MAG: cation-efflux pump, partial [Bacteroidaceae bacterium]|nr:cation-efflux pump [Bacteroidaceae bacterium]
VGNNYVIDVHIRMDGSLTLAHAHNRTIVIEQLLRQRYGSETFVSIHVEPRR